jgi:hypothetical protein
LTKSTFKLNPSLSCPLVDTTEAPVAADAVVDLVVAVDVVVIADDVVVAVNDDVVVVDDVVVLADDVDGVVGFEIVEVGGRRIEEL